MAKHYYIVDMVGMALCCFEIFSLSFWKHPAAFNMFLFRWAPKSHSDGNVHMYVQRAACYAGEDMLVCYLFYELDGHHMAGPDMPVATGK